MKRKSAFTIIELLVSIMIIGILSSIGYKQYTEAIMKSKSAALVSQLKSIEAGMAKYYSDTGTMPRNLSYLFDPPTMTVTTAEEVDLIGYVDSSVGGSATDEVIDYWGGPYIENAEMITVTHPLVTTTCTGNIQLPVGLTYEENACLKSELGGKICVGAQLTPGVDTLGLTYGAEAEYNFLIITGLDNQMVKTLYKSVNHKKIKENIENVLASAGEEKLAADIPTSYNSGGGCAAYKFYNSSLKK